MIVPAIIKAMFSNNSLETLYKKRQATRPADENRTVLTVGLCSVLFILIMGFLMSLAWIRQDITTYVKSQPEILILDANPANPWELRQGDTVSCLPRIDCYPQLLRSSTPVKKLDDAELFNYRLSAASKNVKHNVLLRRVIDIGQWQLSKAGVRVINLPHVNYEQAHVFLNGKLIKSDLANASLAISIDYQPGKTPTNYVVDVLYTLEDKTTDLIDKSLGFVPEIFSKMSIMTIEAYNALTEYIASDRAARGDFIGMLARVIMAIFVLALFLAVDGSPETLGLALFMGFEAFAISMRFNWLPITNAEFITHYSFQMGDIMRLYFFLQLARFVDKQVGAWLFWGSVISVPYGIMRMYDAYIPQALIEGIPAHRDTIVGFIGVSVCLRTAWYLRNKNVPWRVIALSIAALGSVEQIIHPISLILPGELHNARILVTTIDVLQPMSAWLFAFAAFINISTLENRVRTLTQKEAKAIEIRREMELGQSVQQSLLNIPDLPDNLKMSCHNEAMLFVSGDTYFVDWNAQKNKLTFLINDATGHGVQAALKASGVNVIASTIWLDGRATSRHNHPLQEYAYLVEGFFARHSIQADILAMSGCEFDPRTGELLLYRANFPFPVVISPTPIAKDNISLGVRWEAIVLPIKNRSLSHYQLLPGSMVLLASDGYLNSSRRTGFFIKDLQQELAKMSSDVDLEKVKDILLNCKIFKDGTNPDDRTFTIFKWDNFHEIGSKQEIKPSEQQKGLHRVA